MRGNCSRVFQMAWSISTASTRPAATSSRNYSSTFTIPTATSRSPKMTCAATWPASRCSSPSTINHLGEREAENIPAAVPGCRVLIAGRKQQAWNGVGVTLRGLPRDQAVALFEKNWGRASPQDRSTVEAICQALDDVPLSIIKISMAASIAETVLATGPVAGPDGRPRSGRRGLRLVAGQLSQEQRRVLGGLAAPGGRDGRRGRSGRHHAHPGRATGPIAAGVQHMGLVYANSPRYSLDEGFVPYYRGTWASDGMQPGRPSTICGWPPSSRSIPETRTNGTDVGAGLLLPARGLAGGGVTSPERWTAIWPRRGAGDSGQSVSTRPGRQPNNWATGRPRPRPRINWA